MARNLHAHTFCFRRVAALIWYSGAGRLVRVSPEWSSEIAGQDQRIDGSTSCHLLFSFLILFFCRKIAPSVQESGQGVEAD